MYTYMYSMSVLGLSFPGQAWRTISRTNYRRQHEITANCGAAAVLGQGGVSNLGAATVLGQD